MRSPAPHEQHGAQCELREYEHGSSAPTASVAAAPPRAEEVDDVPTGDMERGDEAEGEPGDDGERGREGKHADIDAHVLGARQRGDAPCG
jgi:hypothetical protein